MKPLSRETGRVLLNSRHQRRFRSAVSSIPHTSLMNGINNDSEKSKDDTSKRYDRDYIINVTSGNSRARRLQSRNILSHYPGLASSSTTGSLIGNSPGGFVPGNMGYTSINNGGVRGVSSLTDLIPAVPEFAQNWTVWGGSGFILKTFHHDGLLPYWACMGLTNVLVRCSLIPLVIQAAHVSTRFATVAPEVQFLMTIYQNDSKRMRAEKASGVEQGSLMLQSLKTFRQIYRLHKIHPLAIFKSPLMQIPVFWYFSIDIRKIINGADPELAQALTDSGFLWVTDLCEPDPYHGLPIMCGLLLYLNVEMAIGKKNLSGETASKSNIAILLKDFFQTISVFMPCFMSQSPAGVQIYLMTSFVFTMFQGMALRNDASRKLIGLPSMNAPRAEGALASDFIRLKEMERKAQEVRGDGEVLGIGVMISGWEISFPGTNRPSTIDSGPDFGGIGSGTVLMANTKTDGSGLPELRPAQLSVTGEAATRTVMMDSERASMITTEKSKMAAEAEEKEKQETYMAQIPEDVMEAANRGELPPRPITMAPADVKKAKPLDVKKFVSKKKMGKSKKSPGKKPLRK
eukprot:CAMPEP_0198282758 /NCGR_PEP_ID=MMETSP1449-20131203/2522_1 /TAXON_ID=420275 /ORGANISM="Attheya septentrionalis, Strain CCMP2084" /LENGTH=572 /DNA_ID=CAMNT_0043979149 /DNA_START=21 /DNA_END=1739 /DNA_ORIENTATION=-